MESRESGFPASLSPPPANVSFLISHHLAARWNGAIAVNKLQAAYAHRSSISILSNCLSHLGPQTLKTLL